MGSKQRRKSKSSRRQPTPGKAKLIANDQELTQPNVGEVVKDDANVAQEPSQELLSPVIDGVDEVTTSESAPGTPKQGVEEFLPASEARQVLELFVVSLLAASISPQAALSNARSREVSLTELEDLLVRQLDEADFVQFHQRLQTALRSVCQVNNGTVDASVLFELVGAATFRVEILEFQIRQAILDRSSSKSRSKVDVQRAVGKLLASVPQDSAAITAADFEAMLEEKLGISAGSSLLSRVTFARIVGLPFRHPLPKTMESPKQAFFAALETFVVDKPLSLDSVEGQLRHLVSNHADLHASFKSLDADSSGAISVDEIVTFLQREAHMQYPRDVIAAFIKRFDIDGDGTLSVEEFVAFVSPKQFGIQVLTPFGIFYHAADRHERMRDVVAKIKTRMFWMQHNDLFATSTQPVYKPPLKLKVSDHFILTHHYGKLQLRFKESDPIASVLKNGEMVVLVMEPNAPAKALVEDGSLPEFEYRLKPNVKRSIPPLMSWAMDEGQDQAAPSSCSVEVRKSSLYPRKATRRSNPGDHPVIRRPEDDAVSVASTLSLATSRSSKTSAKTNTAAVKRKATGASRRGMEQETTLPMKNLEQASATRDESPPETPLSNEEPLTRVVETLPPLSSIEASTEYEYYDGDSSADEDRDVGDAEEKSRNNFQGISHGDECGPPEVFPGDETVDCDEEEPPPAYDS